MKIHNKAYNKNSQTTKTQLSHITKNIHTTNKKGGRRKGEEEGYEWRCDAKKENTVIKQYIENEERGRCVSIKNESTAE